MKLKLSEIKTTNPQRQHGDIKNLAESIRKQGLLQPLVINQYNELICGRRRFEAAKSLGWEEADIYRINTNDKIDKLAKSIVENIKRLDLAWQEEVKAKDELDKLMRLKYGEQPSGKHRSSAESAEDEWSTKKTSKLLQEPERTTQTDIQLAKALKKYPKLEKCKTKQGALRELKLKNQIKKLKENPPKAPEGFYDVIVIDPPWEMEGNYDPKGRRGIPPYPTMNIDKIKSLKIPANKDCILWLWVTNRKMKYAFDILETWGFEERNILTWVKDKFGLGDWLRNQTEHCILAIKGKPIFLGQKDKTVLYGKRTVHSAKPDEFYQLVERTCRGRKLDYFSRKKRDNWDSFGDEI